MNGKHTVGEATVERIKIHGQDTISVGIMGTTKAIAVCGFVGAADEAESEANAVRLAMAWNLVNKIQNS